MATGERQIITDTLVRRLSGEELEHWFRLLDELGAREKEHAGIFGLVASLKSLEPLGQWNQHLLTTTYEWSRGLRQRGQKEDGFEISVSKTINVPVTLLFHAWNDEALRERWLPGRPLLIRKATENKSLRITWSDGHTHLSVELYVKGERKTQVVVQHRKLPDAAEAALWKTYWTERLEALKTLLG